MEQQMIPNNLTRIAAIIRREWKDIHFGAAPHLEVMGHLTSILETDGHTNGINVVASFLANAACWHGPTADRVKDKLRELLDGAIHYHHPHNYNIESSL
ncbi:hypothetical protein SAMN05661044_00651 [Olivibacter domesticus]|uniref:Uncharacterized protein n=2 Tax=Olivibacter domesticus TaxID=407022 RepID=A0A1H7IH24_OLID1|nr:hypothetical protein SAMN05661044_00651 [Olivibacter domesticus]